MTTTNQTDMSQTQAEDMTEKTANKRDMSKKTADADSVRGSES